MRLRPRRRKSRPPPRRRARTRESRRPATPPFRRRCPRGQGRETSRRNAGGPGLRESRRPATPPGVTAAGLSGQGKHAAREGRRPGAKRRSAETRTKTDAETRSADPERENSDRRRRQRRRPSAKAAPKKQLTAAQVELRDRIRRTLEAQLQQPFNTRDNTAADLIKFCWAFGCRSEVERGDAPGTEGQRRHLPVLGPSLRRIPPAGGRRRPDCRPRRLRPARRSRPVPGDVGVGLRPHRLSAPRRENGPHRGRPGRVGEARLPLRGRHVAEIGRPVALCRAGNVEEQPGRGLVDQADGRFRVGPAAGCRTGRDHEAAGARVVR